MRLIKFRVKRRSTGATTYIDFRTWLASLDVAESPVHQLVGTDEHGEEVYEGDEVYCPTSGTTFKAAMNHVNAISNCRRVEK